MSEHATQAVSPTNSEEAFVFKINSIPRKPKYFIGFGFRKSRMILSADLHKRLGLEQYSRVAFVLYRGGIFVTRCDHKDAFNVTIYKGLNGFTSALIRNKNFTEYMRQFWKCDLDDYVRVPVVDLMTTASDLGLDVLQYPHPLYRLVLDQKKLRNERT